MSTTLEPPLEDPIGTSEVVQWSNPWASVRTVPVLDVHGAFVRTHTVMRSGTGKGAVVVPVLVFRGVRHFGLVASPRPAASTLCSVEFPRGGTDDLGVDEACRELIEETGQVATTTKTLGLIRPDSGILDTEVVVVLATVRPVLDEFGSWTRQGMGHVDPETGAIFTWTQEGEFVSMLRAGRIECAMTLAAYLLAVAHLPQSAS